jgi:flagellar L-ring protein precursor FlgH
MSHVSRSAWLTLVPVLVAGCASRRHKEVADLLARLKDTPALEQEPPLPGSLYPPESRSLFEDAVARRVGDVVTVVVSESLQAKRDAKTSTSRETDVAIGAFLTLDAVSLGGNREFDGKGSVSKTGYLTTRMAARVVDTGRGGALRIAGLRQVEVDGDVQTLVLTGIVRPQDVRIDNTVLSQDVAELRMAVLAKGTLHDATKRGWIHRVLDLLNVF